MHKYYVYIYSKRIMIILYKMDIYSNLNIKHRGELSRYKDMAPNSN